MSTRELIAQPAAARPATAEPLAAQPAAAREAHAEPLAAQPAAARPADVEPLAARRAAAREADAKAAGEQAAGAAERARVIGSDEEAIACARALVERIAAGAAERDRERRLPVAEVELLSREGLLAITVPAEHGGAGVSVATLAEVIRLLASADPNVAQIPHSHFVYLELVRQLGTPAQRELLFGRVLAGERLANAQSEAGSKTIADIRTSLRAAAHTSAQIDGREHADGPWGAVGPGGALVLEGEKFYCTGSLLADWLMVLARGHGERTYVAVVPADAPGVSIVDDWGGMGQRTTASGTVKLERVEVDRSMVIPHHRLFERPQVYGARAQLLHTAIDVGIAAGALEEACELVRTLSRPWFEAGVQRAAEDPLLIQRVGELAIEVRAAHALLGEAARTIDEVERYAARAERSSVSGSRADASSASGPRDEAVREEDSARASIAVAAAKALADRVSVNVTAALFELAGTRSAADALNLHRHWRNARTHTLHDPVRWKLQHIGRYTLSGVLPPQHGQL
jgi:alkylation response protein AidB-like acyl-CoA dehydrogenase